MTGTLNIHSQIPLSREIDRCLDMPRFAHVDDIRRIAIRGAWALAIGKAAIVVIVLPIVADGIVRVPLRIVPFVPDVLASLRIVFWLCRMTGRSRCRWQNQSSAYGSIERGPVGRAWPVSRRRNELARLVLERSSLCGTDENGNGEDQKPPNSTHYRIGIAGDHTWAKKNPPQVKSTASAPRKYKPFEKQKAERRPKGTLASPLDCVFNRERAAQSRSAD
jgi:hypothetical protein